MKDEQAWYCELCGGPAVPGSSYCGHLGVCVSKGASPAITEVHPTTEVQQLRHNVEVLKGSVEYFSGGYLAMKKRAEAAEALLRERIDINTLVIAHQHDKAHADWYRRVYELIISPAPPVSGVEYGAEKKEDSGTSLTAVASVSVSASKQLSHDATPLSNGKQTSSTQNLSETAPNSAAALAAHRAIDRYLTVGDLRHLTQGLPDSAKVYYQRIEDAYFEKHGWTTIEQPGYDGPDHFVRAFTAWPSDEDGGMFLITAHY